MIVNQETEYPWTFAAMFSAIVIVNLVTAVVVHRKEKTWLNKIIICDCLFNVINMGTFFLNKLISWKLLGSSQLCAICFFFRITIHSKSKSPSSPDRKKITNLH